jgi:molecular chaperone HtpG
MEQDHPMAQQFQVDLRAVVELLARHVYSSPRVFVRELIQNGVDAVTAARQLDPARPAGPIEFLPSDAGGDGALVVRDPGIGLTVDEVHELLATIGGSSKRDELDLPREGFLGRFGIGLLSCFVVADRIEVVTRSLRGGPAVRFVGRDDGTYEVQELAEDGGPATAGTSVRLVPRPDAWQWVGFETVDRLAKLFGSELPVAVHVHRPEGGVSEVNDPDPPWLVAPGERARRSAQVAWCERRFGFTPLDVIPIEAAGSGARGVAFVLPAESLAASHPGHLGYLRRMLLADDLRGVLPDWAFFVRAVLDVGNLQPTASRESLVEDDALEDAQQELGASLRDWLVRLGATDPNRLQHILGVHGRAAKALASHDDDVFAALGPWLRFETTVGDLTIAEIVRQAGTIRFAPTVDRFRMLAPIAGAQGLVVVNAGYSYDQELLARAHVAEPGAESVELGDEEIVATLDDVTAERGAWAAAFLAQAGESLEEVGCDVQLRAFDQQARDRRRLRSTADEVDDEWAALLSDLDDGKPDRPMLVLNDRHALVRRLVDAAVGERGVVGTVAQALYVQALLLGHYPLRGTDLALLNRALLDLVDRAIVDEGTT